MKGIKFYESLIQIYQEAPDQTAIAEALTLAQTMLTLFKTPNGNNAEHHQELLARTRARLNPPKQLPAAPIERMMAEVVEVDQPKQVQQVQVFEPEIVEAETCKHGYPAGQCVVMEVGYDCPHWYRNQSTPSAWVIG
jgi:hypothetical protein